MKTSEFSFDLPVELIAQEPAARRESSRLMVVNRETLEISHAAFPDLATLVPCESLIVFNDSRVNKSRLLGRSSATGGRVEFLLFERRQADLWLALVEKSRKQRRGKTFKFAGDLEGRIESDYGSMKLVRFDREVDGEYLVRFGSVPLPPYIKRPPSEQDERRYQTVYARSPGSAAAPTAGLHFTHQVLHELERRGAGIAHITLHVGPGTFVPIRSTEIENHKMHEESYTISDETAVQLNEALRQERPIVAVGTTVVRALESAYKYGKGTIGGGQHRTDLYICPGFRFRMIRHLFTNFHTPRSSLLVMVSAFAGRKLIRKAYAQAIREKYRFFSYGDAMYII